MNQKEEYIIWKLGENQTRLEKLKTKQTQKKEDLKTLEKEKEKNEVALSALRSELNDISEEFKLIKKENNQLNKDKKKLDNLGKISITSHAIVQFLDRAKGMNISEFREKVKSRIVDGELKTESIAKIQDHQVVEYLINEGIIDLPDVERQILPDNIRDLITKSELIGGSGIFTTKDGYRLAVNGMKVVTFLPRKEKSKKISKLYIKKEKRRPRKMKL